MQVVSQTWSDIYDIPAHKASYKIVIDGIEYGEETIIKITSSCDVFQNSKPIVGQCISAQMEANLYLSSNSIPRRAECKLYTKLYYGSSESEWIPQGTFYIDKRKKSKHTGVLNLKCFDAMMKADKLMYTDDGEQEYWPQTDIDVVETIAEDYLGVEINPMTLQLLNKAYEVQFPGYGDEGYTVNQVLGYIGAMYGGNWIINDAGQLTLLKLSKFPPVSGPGSNVRFELSPTDGHLTVVHPDLQRETPTFELDSVGHIFVTYPDGYTGPKYDLYPDGSIGAILYQPEHEIDDEAEDSEELIPFEQISRVTINVSTDEETGEPIYYTAGDDTHSEFKLECPWGTQSMCDTLLNELSTLVYNPYNLVNAVINPAFELWDGVYTDGTYTGITCYKRYFDPLFSADISATGEQELDSEYPYVSRESLINKQTNAKLRSSLKLTNSTISSLIESTNGSFSSMQQDINGLRLDIVSINAEDEDLKRYLSWGVDGLILGIPNQNTKVQLTETKLGFVDGTGDTKAFIGLDPNDNVYKLFVIKGHIVNELEHGDHFVVITSDQGTTHRFTIKARI